MGEDEDKYRPLRSSFSLETRILPNKFPSPSLPLGFGLKPSQNVQSLNLKGCIWEASPSPGLHHGWCVAEPYHAAVLTVSFPRRRAAVIRARALQWFGKFHLSTPSRR